MNYNYIIIGDSIVYGIGDYENGGWAEQFKKYIVSKDDSRVCSNFVQIAGFPGSSSKEIIERIDSIIKSYKYEDFNNTIILSVGVNDTKYYNNSFNVDINEFRINIESIIRKVLNNNCHLIILGLTRIGTDSIEFKPDKFYTNSTIDEYDNELEKICNENSVKYISMKDILNKDDFIDDLHPNTNGHSKIYETVKEQLRC